MTRTPPEPLSDAALDDKWLDDFERWVAFHVKHHSDTRMEVFPHKIAAVLSRLRLVEAQIELYYRGCYHAVNIAAGIPARAAEEDTRG